MLLRWILAQWFSSVRDRETDIHAIVPIFLDINSAASQLFDVRYCFQIKIEKRHLRITNLNWDHKSAAR